MRVNSRTAVRYWLPDRLSAMQPKLHVRLFHFVNLKAVYSSDI